MKCKHGLPADDCKLCDESGNVLVRAIAQELVERFKKVTAAPPSSDPLHRLAIKNWELTALLSYIRELEYENERLKQVKTSVH